MRRRRFGGMVFVGVLAVAVLATACQPLPPTWKLTGGGTTFGNVVTTLDNPTVPSCPSFQPGGGSCTTPPSFWAAISGPYAAHGNGDPYATKCTGTSNGTPATCDNASSTSGAVNPDYRGSYRYALDISEADAAAGTPVSFFVYDLETSPRTVGSSADVDCRTTVAPFTSPAFAGIWSLSCQTGDYQSVNTDVQVFDDDRNPNTISYLTPLTDCRRTVLATDDPTPYKNRWVRLCTIEAPRAGTYPVVVSSSGIPGVADAGTGINDFALAIDGAPTSSIRALDDVSINFADLRNGATIPVADVSPIHQGRKLRVDLFDGGDGQGTVGVQLIAPPSGPRTGPGDGVVVPAAGVATACAYNATPSSSSYVGSPPDPATSCFVTTSSSKYHDRWLRIEVQLDPAYTCGTTGGDCWWTLRYQTGTASTSDRLAYRVSVA